MNLQPKPKKRTIKNTTTRNKAPINFFNVHNFFFLFSFSQKKKCFVLFMENKKPKERKKKTANAMRIFLFVFHFFLRKICVFNVKMRK
jgi:hypothetical protein